MNNTLSTVELFAQLCDADASVAEVGECEAAVGAIARMRSLLDAREAAYTRRLRQLHDAGKAETASSIIAGASNTSTRDARAKERRSEMLDTASSFADGLEQGRISGDHIDALANVCSKLDDNIRDKVLDDQGALLDYASNHTPADLAKQLRDLARIHEQDQGVERDAQQRRDTYVNIKLDPTDGMYHLRGKLHPELGSAVNSAIQQHTRAKIRSDKTLRTVDRGQVMAEALGELLAGGHAAARPTAQVNVIVDYDTLIGRLSDGGVCETSDGAPLPAWKARQLACDNDILPIVLSGDSVPLDVGRSKRFFTADQRTALRAVYSTCAMPGCDVAFDNCEIHHLDEWEHGGCTDLCEGLPICSHCHHTIHQPGWVLKLAPDRTLTITSPTGRVLTGRPV